MIRLLQICDEFPPAPHGGIGSATVDLAPELTARGVDLTIVGTHPPAEAAALRELDAELDRPYRVFRFDSTLPRIPFPLRVWADRRLLRFRLERLYRESPFDLLLTEDYDGLAPMGAPGMSRLLVRLNGSNLVYDDLLERDGSRTIWKAERQTLQRADVWIGVSEFFLRETVERISPPPATRLEVIPNPVDTKLFTPAENEDVSVEGRIVFHNTLGPRKGLQDLFAALPSVFQAEPSAHLEIYGTAANFDEIVATLTASLPEAHRGRVRFFGRVDRSQSLPGILEKARVACYPSHLETFGIAPVEAMSMKRVTIYSNNGPGPEIIEDGVDGFLCPPRDPDALARTLIRALRLPVSERLAMGESARAKAVSHFDREHVADRYLELFRSLLPSS